MTRASSGSSHTSPHGFGRWLSRFNLTFVQRVYQLVSDAPRWQPHVARFKQQLRQPVERQQLDGQSAVGEIMSHAVRTVPHYRDLVGDNTPNLNHANPTDSLESFPLLTKRTVRRHADALLSNTFPRTHLHREHTGGSTSAPTPFFQEEIAIRDKEAAAEAMRNLMGWTLGDRVAYLWGADQDIPSRSPRGLARRFKQWFLARIVLRSLFLPAGTLNDKVLARYVKRIQRYKPAVLQAYPSAADLMARWILKNKVDVTIPLTVLTAEPTYDDQRARIQEALHTNVTTFYGSREVGWVAAECPTHHRLHINTATVWLETADDGNLLITDLCNHAMPLIRYEVGDLARVSDEACPCGDPRPIFESLEGRSTDVFIMPSGRRVLGVLLDVRGLHHDAGGIVDAQIVQEELGAIDLYYVPGPAYKPSDLEGFIKHLDDVCEHEVEIRTHSVNRLTPEPNGKMRYCICRLEVDEDDVVSPSPKD